MLELHSIVLEKDKSKIKNSFFTFSTHSVQNELQNMIN